MIQLTFTDGIVTTHTNWLPNKIPTEFRIRKPDDTWSTLEEWLHDEEYGYQLLATSTEPITSITNPELLI